MKYGIKFHRIQMSHSHIQNTVRLIKIFTINKVVFLINLLDRWVLTLLELTAAFVIENAKPMKPLHAFHSAVCILGVDFTLETLLRVYIIPLILSTHRNFTTTLNTSQSYNELQRVARRKFFLCKFNCLISLQSFMTINNASQAQ